LGAGGEKILDKSLAQSVFSKSLAEYLRHFSLFTDDFLRKELELHVEAYNNAKKSLIDALTLDELYKHVDDLHESLIQNAAIIIACLAILEFRVERKSLFHGRWGKKAQWRCDSASAPHA